MAAFKKYSGKFAVNIFVYLMLIELAFVFVYPLLFMVVNSLKFDFDIRDSNRLWVVTKINDYNYTAAFERLNYFKALGTTALIAAAATIGHALTCAFTAYGFARFKFPGANVLFGLVILSVIIPPQLLFMPLYIQYSKIGWITTILPIVVPSFFAFGLKGGFFIFIYRQYFKGLPVSYEEAAKIEGCSPIPIFFRIILPMSRSSVLVVAILSVIWHWSDWFEPFAYLKGSTRTLSQALDGMQAYFYAQTTGGGASINPVQLAACVLVIAPVLVLFAIFQKSFTQGIETSGLAN